MRGPIAGQFPTMTTSLPSVQSPALVDTVVMRVVPPDPSWFAQTVSVAGGLLTIAACAVLVGVILLALRQRRVAAEQKGTLVALGRDLAELLSAANRISQELAAISATVRADVAVLHDTVDYTNRRARRAVAALADRVDVFTETVAVVQDEAQDVIVNGLAAVRGVRAGVRAVMRGDASDATVPAPRVARPRPSVERPAETETVRGPHLRRHRRRGAD